MRAQTVKGADGKFYIVPISAGCSGYSFVDERKARCVADAINAAYNDGRESIREEFRALFNVGEGNEWYR